jgi:hypothetical protein
VTFARASAPRPSYRLIPSRFPPVGAFDTVATTADLEAVMALEGWTNDRLVSHRLARLPKAEWVFGRANASAIMASFLHVAPGGSRFNTADLGAWYAAAAVATAAAEVAHHLRRETADRRAAVIERDFRCYAATLGGEYVDISDRQTQMPDIYASGDYRASQVFGEELRASGEAGILYDSLRHAGGHNAVSFLPSLIGDVMPTDHYRITAWAAERRIDVRRLTGA